MGLYTAQHRRNGGIMTAWLGRLAQGALLGLLAYLVFAPIANLALWAVAIRWYFPYKLPLTYGFRYWYDVFKPTSDAVASLGTSIEIAIITVVVCLLLAIPAGYALSRRRLPGRALILLILLLPQAFPSVAVYLNIARLFYMIGLNGTIAGVVLVHAVHGLVIAVWIAAAAFAAVDAELELAARNMGASAARTVFTVTLPLAAPGLIAAAIFVFLESLDEFTGTYFVGVPDVTTLPLMMYNASLNGNYQIAAITALILLVPSILFMLLIERFLSTDTLAKIG
jgi:ABC-type spermidine/putrescine transport system permease subunit II